MDAVPIKFIFYPIEDTELLIDFMKMFSYVNIMK
jgi:hypothetical protein